MNTWGRVYPNRCPVCGREHLVREESCNDNATRRIIREELARLERRTNDDQ